MIFVCLYDLSISGKQGLREVILLKLRLLPKKHECKNQTASKNYWIEKLIAI